MWLNFVTNDNEILINISSNCCELFNFDTINHAKLDKKIERCIMNVCKRREIDCDLITIYIFYINNQNTQLIEIKANQTEIDSDDIELELQEMTLDDCYYTDEEMIELINSELESIDLADRTSVENFLNEHTIIKSIVEDSSHAYDEIYVTLKSQYFTCKQLSF
jgi:hypothetical protein